MTSINNLEKTVSDLVQKAASLRQASEAANMAVARALYEWHGHTISADALVSTQEKAMADALRLSEAEAHLAAARAALAKAIAEAEKNNR